MPWPFLHWRGRCGVAGHWRTSLRATTTGDICAGCACHILSVGPYSRTETQQGMTQGEVTNACRFRDVLNDAGNCVLVLSRALSGIEFEIKRKLDKADA
jgi:hypothetical protein